MQVYFFFNVPVSCTSPQCRHDLFIFFHLCVIFVNLNIGFTIRLTKFKLNLVINFSFKDCLLKNVTCRYIQKWNWKLFNIFKMHTFIIRYQLVSIFLKYGFDRLNSSNILVYTLVFIIIFCTQVHCICDNNGASNKTTRCQKC